MENVMVNQEWLEEQVCAASSEINKAKKSIILGGIMLLICSFSSVFIFFGADTSFYRRLIGASAVFIPACVFIAMIVSDIRHIHKQRLRRAVAKYHLARIAAHELFEPR